MSALRFRKSRPDTWIQPRQQKDAHRRFLVHGPIQPMDEDRPTLLERFFGMR